MTDIPFFIADVFTQAAFAGNPAGVFLDTHGLLTNDQMKTLAGEVHLESAFVSPPDTAGADYRIQYFTGLTEVPLCGHATVAAVAALVQSGRICFVPSETTRTLHLQTRVGVLRVDIRRSGKNEAEQVTLFQTAPVFGPPLAGNFASGVYRAVVGTNGEGEARVPGLSVQVVSTGTPWLFVPVSARASVDTSPADLDAILQISHETQTWGAFVFACEEDKAGLTTWSRCFAPRAGLNEDPVTGSASGALGCYLARHGVLPVSPDTPAQFTNAQGFAGGRGGVVGVTVSGTPSDDLRVGITGEAVVVAEGVFRV